MCVWYCCAQGVVLFLSFVSAIMKRPVWIASFKTFLFLLELPVVFLLFSSSPILPWFLFPICCFFSSSFSPCIEINLSVIQLLLLAWVPECKIISLQLLCLPSFLIVVIITTTINHPSSIIIFLIFMLILSISLFSLFFFVPFSLYCHIYC